jgi:hypothetical protein
MASNKIKKRQVGLYQYEKFLYGKGNNHKMKRQLTERKKIFAKQFDLELIFKYMRQSYNTIEKVTIQFKNGQRN